MDIVELFQGPQVSGSASFARDRGAEKTARNLGGQVTLASHGIPNFQIPCFGVKNRNLKQTLESIYRRQGPPLGGSS